MKVEEAIILVGGLGTRLREVTGGIPKPLAPVAGRPFLAWVLDRLDQNGMRRVVLAAGYRAGEVQRVIGRTWRRMAVDYSIESSPLGTGGAVRQACEMLHGNAVHVLNGDTFLDYHPAEFSDATMMAGAQIGLALASVPDVARYGAVERSACGVITGFREKGSGGPGYVNAGCYFLAPEAVAALPSEASYSFETAFLGPMVAACRVYGYADTNGFIDIGVPEDYRRAQDLFGVADGS